MRWIPLPAPDTALLLEPSPSSGDFTQDQDTFGMVQLPKWDKSRFFEPNINEGLWLEEKQSDCKGKKKKVALQCIMFNFMILNLSRGNSVPGMAIPWLHLWAAIVYTEGSREFCMEIHIYLKDLLMLRPKKIITTLRFDPEQRALIHLGLEFILLKSNLSLFNIWQAVQESSLLLLPFYFCL